MKVFAVHTDGRKLYYPEWKSNGELRETGLPTAAVAIDQEGVTFPPGSTWIRGQRTFNLLKGWTLVEEKPEKPSRKVRRPNQSYLNRINEKTDAANKGLIQT